MPATYEKIQSTTLTSNAANVTFSSIPATYTDLHIVLYCLATAGVGVLTRFNNDSGNNYSKTQMTTEGATSIAILQTSQSSIALSYSGLDSTTPSLLTWDILGYAGNTLKTVLAFDAQDRNGSGSTSSYAGLWRDATAISTITLVAGGSTYEFTPGTTASLYGILKA